MEEGQLWQRNIWVSIPKWPESARIPDWPVKKEERFNLSNDREDCGAKNLDTRGATPFSSCGIGRKQWVVGRNGELTTLLSIIIVLMMRMVMKMVAVGIRTKQPRK